MQNNCYGFLCCAHAGSKKPLTNTDYGLKKGGGPKYPPLLNSTFRFRPNTQIINDYPQLMIMCSVLISDYVCRRPS